MAPRDPEAVRAAAGATADARDGQPQTTKPTAAIVSKAATPASDPLIAASLVSLMQGFGSSLDLDQVLRNVAEGIQEQVPHDTFAILLLDDLGRHLSFRFAVGYAEEVVSNWQFGLGQGLVGTAAEQARLLRVDDVRSDPRYISAAPGLRSELAIPLVAKGRTIGVLDVGSRQPAAFTPTHEQILVFLAGHLANGIENARLYENVRRQARTLSVLHEVSRELNSILDREKLLRKIAEGVKRLIDYQLFSVMLWNEDTQELEHTFSLRFDERFAFKKGFPLGHGVTGTAAALRQPMRVPNVHLNPHYVSCEHGVEVRSELAVPLVFKDRLIGVLDLESIEYNAFSEQHEQMLQTLAAYVAVALENARLYEKVRAGERRLEDDLQTAREVQRGLLPPTPAPERGLEVGFAYESARQLGGDFYDVLPYGDCCTAVAVGDAAGKGSAAALHAAVAVGVLRGRVVERPCGPAAMLAEMNTRLRQPGLENRFVAMAFTIYDHSDRSARIANAGFTRPLLVRSGIPEIVGVEGVPLGLLSDVSYDEVRVSLEPGDLLVFCSDGIAEALNCRRQEEFGTRRLQKVLAEVAGRPATEIAEELLRHAQGFACDASGPADDRTIVVLKAV